MLICLASMRCVDYTYFRYHSMWHIANDGSHLFLQIIRHVMIDIAVLKMKEYMLERKNYNSNEHELEQSKC